MDVKSVKKNLENCKTVINQSLGSNEKLMAGFRLSVKKELLRQCLEIELEIAKQYAATDWRLWQQFGTSDKIC